MCSEGQRQHTCMVSVGCVQDALQGMSSQCYYLHGGEVTTRHCVVRCSAVQVVCKAGLRGGEC